MKAVVAGAVVEGPVLVGGGLVLFLTGLWREPLWIVAVVFIAAFLALAVGLTVWRKAGSDTSQ